MKRSKRPNRLRVVYDYGDWRVESVYGHNQYDVVQTYPTKREALNRGRRAAERMSLPLEVYRKDETPSIQEPQRTLKKWSE